MKFQSFLVCAIGFLFAGCASTKVIKECSPQEELIVLYPNPVVLWRVGYGLDDMYVLWNTPDERVGNEEVKVVVLLNDGNGNGVVAGFRVQTSLPSTEFGLHQFTLPSSDYQRYSTDQIFFKPGEWKGDVTLTRGEKIIVRPVSFTVVEEPTLTLTVEKEKLVPGKEAVTVAYNFHGLKPISLHVKWWRRNEATGGYSLKSTQLRTPNGTKGEYELSTVHLYSGSWECTAVGYVGRAKVENRVFFDVVE